MDEIIIREYRLPYVYHPPRLERLRRDQMGPYEATPWMMDYPEKYTRMYGLSAKPPCHCKYLIYYHCLSSVA